jgi:CBS domain-containing protein
MVTVRQLLEGKSRDLWTISPDASVFEALEQLAEKDIGALLVTEGEKLVGIFSERDYARKVALKGRTSKETTIGELMTRDVRYVQPEHTVEQCMVLMTDKRIRHLPVLQDRKLVGIVSIGDVVKAVISDQADTIQFLQQYLTGGRTK